jgi:hypothetical protein
MSIEPERIERLENRVDKIEDNLGNEVEKLSLKIDALGAVINNHLIASAKAHCPSPGACLVLANDLKSVVASNDHTMKKVIYLENRILEIEKWQGRMLGALSVLVILLTLFGPTIRKALRLE